MTVRWRAVSYWFDSLAGTDALQPRAGLPGDLDVDVAIVGAGYTGLWTAYYLSALDPGLRIVVLEQETAGFGASGRNGGWCSSFFARSDASIASEVGLAGMHAMRKAMQGAVDEVGGVAAAEGIDCHFRKSGTVSLARTSTQLTAARDEVREARSLGIGEQDVALLGAEEAARLVGATSVLGGVFTPHCASVHPARLVRGLAEAVERRGVPIYERTEVRRLGRAGPSGARHRLDTARGRVKADVAVLATEGYSPSLPGWPGWRRQVLPLYSLMVSTEPLSNDVLASIGIEDGLTFTDGRHLLIYGQRTLDGRLAFGGRGAPYHAGSRVDEAYDREAKVHDALRSALSELFPQIGGVRLSHTWGGPLGVHRDWYPSVSFDRWSGLARAGGYVGDGVSTTNLAGRTLADLICGRATDLTELCWVGHRSPDWEPEPLRWLGVNAGLAATAYADTAEARTGRPSKVAGLVERLTGH